MNKHLYIVRGLPGSGKSTLARKLTGSFFGVYEADNYMHNGDGVYKFDPAKLGFCHTSCQQDLETEMKIEDPQDPILAVANTFSRRWEMEPYLALARKYGYQVTVIEVQSGLSDDELAARNVHGVDRNTIAKMRARWER